jgi:beta-1,4-mannosyltransferase
MKSRSIDRTAANVYRSLGLQSIIVFFRICLQDLMSPKHNRRVAVVVLGDFGRSPRMQYHTLALAESGSEVDVVAYAGSPPISALRGHPRVRLHLLSPPRLGQTSNLPAAVFAALMLLRVCRQSVQLLWLLGLRLPKPGFILVQNPPAIPTLLIALIAARARSARLVIDWHNFGWSMLALKLNKRGAVVRMARWYEQNLGPAADRHLCVSEAMRTELAEHWGITGAVVLYDGPAAQFAPTPPGVREDLLRRISAGLDYVADRDQCPGLIVYPTGWTEDEDIALLLDAAVRCDAMIDLHDRRGADRPFAHLLILITGQGPLRDHYQREIARLRLKKVHLFTLWLAPEDYPLMLGAADLGLCCHRSSSGFDLPMKIADLMGTGVPVLALDYGVCLAERVRDGENGLLFENAEQLASQLYELFEGFPAAPRLKRLRENVRRQQPMRWADGWKAAAAPIFAPP